MAKNSDKAEIVMIGYNGMHKNTNYMKGIEFTHVNHINFFEYYQGILDLAFNVVLIPARKNKFNTTSKNYIKWLEFTNIGVSVIMPDMEPYNKVVTHNSTGIVCGSTEDWIKELNVIMTDKVKSEEIYNSAYSLAMEYNIDLSNNLGILEEFFVIK